MHQSIPAAPIPPPSPGQLQRISMHCQSQGLGISLPRGYPQSFDARMISDLKSKCGRFYWKTPVVCHRLACLSRTGQNCGCF